MTYIKAPLQFPKGLLEKDIFDIFERATDEANDYKNPLTEPDIAMEITAVYEDALNQPTVIDMIGNAIDYGAVDFDKIEQSIIDQFDKMKQDGLDGKEDIVMEFDLIEQGVIDAWSKQTTMLTLGGTPTTPLVPPSTHYSSFITPPGYAIVSNASIISTFQKGTIPPMPKQGRVLQQNSYIISKRFTDLFTKHIQGINIIYTGFLPPTGTIPFPPAPPFSSGNLTLL